MAEYIEREALLNALSESAEPFNTASVFRAIKRQSKADVAPVQWISVKDRLPSRDGLEHDEVEYVLVAVNYSDFGFASEVTVCGYEEYGWSKFDFFGSAPAERITHWMPMPEPPEED